MTTSGGRAADRYLQADARAGVEALDNLLEKRSFKSIGYHTGETKERLSNALDDRTEFKLDPDTVDPRPVCLALDEMVPTDVALYTGSGATAGFSNILFSRRRPVVLASHFFGCIGQMMPAAMVALAAGNKPGLLVDGDASIMMHLAEFETMVRYNMPLLIIVMNNQMLGAEYYKLDKHKMKSVLSHHFNARSRRGCYGVRRQRTPRTHGRRSARRCCGVGLPSPSNDD